MMNTTEAASFAGAAARGVSLRAVCSCRGCRPRDDVIANSANKAVVGDGRMMVLDVRVHATQQRDQVTSFDCLLDQE